MKAFVQEICIVFQSAGKKLKNSNFLKNFIINLMGTQVSANCQFLNPIDVDSLTPLGGQAGRTNWHPI